MVNRILLTGFEPFGGEEINPSWEAVSRLQGRAVDNTVIESRLMPVSWERCGPAVREAIAEVDPIAVIMVGQAGGRPAFSLERIAVNLQEGSAGDNDGVRREGEPIEADGPDAYLSTLPIKDIHAELLDEGIPSLISNSAGLYLCNYIFYAARYQVERLGGERGGPVPTGFVHIPFAPQQVAARIRNRKGVAASMAMETIAEGLTVAARVTLRRL